MPRGKAFSGKQKKEQLKEKRERKRQQQQNQHSSTDDDDNTNIHIETKLPSSSSASHGKSNQGNGGIASSSTSSTIPHELLTTSLGISNTKQNKLSTILMKEKKENVEARRIASALPIDISSRNHPLYARDRYEEHSKIKNNDGEAILDHPKGILLRQGIKEKQLNSNGNNNNGRILYMQNLENARTIEEEAFNHWLQNIYKTYSRNDLNMFEHNLDVWMQLWHTLATSDIVAILADVRNPLWHIPYSLYTQIIHELKKPLIIVLSKCDLVPNYVSEGWCEWMRNHYPEIKIIRFTASGGYIGDITALSQRKRLLRSARLSHDEYHVNRRIQSAKDLLEAANIPLSSIEYVVQKLQSTIKQSIARSAVKLSVDQIIPTSNNTSTAENVEEEVDNNTDEESNSAEEDNDSFVMEQILEHDDDNSSIDSDDVDDNTTNEDNTKNEANDVTENTADDDESSTSSSSSDGFIRSSQLLSHNQPSQRNTKTSANTNINKSVPTVSSSSTTTQNNANINSNKTKYKGKPKRKGKRSDSSDEGIDRFAGRPRHYKRGDADKKANEIALGFSNTLTLDNNRDVDEVEYPNHKQKKKGKGKGIISADTRNSKTSDRKPKSKSKHESDEENENIEFTGPTEEELAKEETNINATNNTTKRPLTIGFVGHPNVGKSSIINTLCGEKRVSVSRTAGHTKRAQTIHLVPASPGVEPVDLLDCPGLVFPHLLNYSSSSTNLSTSSTSVNNNHDENERAMQECCGVIPLAQVREPYTSIRFLMEHLPIERYYGISPPRDEVIEAQTEGREFQWTALSLCEAYAVKRGYYIARTGRPDAHSAGRAILYDTQDGIIPLWWLPPKEK